MKIPVYLFYSIILLISTSCNKEEFTPYDQPFVHIHVNNQEAIRVRANRNESVEYPVYLSSKLTFESLYVDFEVVAGNGLEEGRDFKIVTDQRTLHFPAGIFSSPITIQWLRNPVDITLDNTLTIRLKSASNDTVMIGLPGPNSRQSSLTITKY